MNKAEHCKPVQNTKTRFPFNFFRSYLAAHFYNLNDISTAVGILKQVIQSGLVCSSGDKIVTTCVCKGDDNHPLSIFRLLCLFV